MRLNSWRKKTVNAVGPNASLVVIRPTDRNHPVSTLTGGIMKRRKMSNQESKRSFKKNTGVHKMNTMNPRNFRGGIRL